MRKTTTRGFTLIECMIAVGIASMLTIGTLSLLYLVRAQNEIEQQRARAHQIVSQKLEGERYLYHKYRIPSNTVTIWDNGTPYDPTDDTVGQMEIVIWDVRTHTLITGTVDPGTNNLVSIEATLTWSPRSGPAHNRTLHESVMAYAAP